MFHEEALYQVYVPLPQHEWANGLSTILRHVNLILGVKGTGESGHASRRFCHVFIARQHGERGVDLAILSVRLSIRYCDIVA